MDQARYRYRIEEVVDCGPPEFAYRTYIEHRDVRNSLNEIARGGSIGPACELGSGFGRMTVLLGEFSSIVHGYEREPEFVELSNRLIPNIEFRNIGSLSSLPAENSFYSFVLSFTVLQHISDAEVEKIAAEIKRITAKGGHLLLCEETSASGSRGPQDPRVHFCVGRSVQQYEEMLRPFRLVRTFPRRVEPTYPRKDTGTYMLFQLP